MFNCSPILLGAAGISIQQHCHTLWVWHNSCSWHCDKHVGDISHNSLDKKFKWKMEVKGRPRVATVASLFNQSTPLFGEFVFHNHNKINHQCVHQCCQQPQCLQQVYDDCKGCLLLPFGAVSWSMHVKPQGCYIWTHADGGMFPLFPVIVLRQGGVCCQ